MKITIEIEENSPVEEEFPSLYDGIMSFMRRWDAFSLKLAEKIMGGEVFP